MGLFGKNTSGGNKAFDCDAYWNDIACGLSSKERQKKFKRMSYYVDKSVIDYRKQKQ